MSAYVGSSKNLKDLKDLSTRIPGLLRARLGKGGVELPAVDKALRAHALHQAHFVLSHDALPIPREACRKSGPFSAVHLHAVSGQGFATKESHDLISEYVLIKWFFSSQLPHKTVNLLFTITNKTAS